MPWWMWLRAAALVVVLLFALYCVVTALFPGLRKKPMTWRGGVPMSWPGGVAFGGFVACIALSELVWPFRLSNPSPAIHVATGVFLAATFVFAIWDFLAYRTGGKHGARERDAPRDDGMEQVATGLNVDLRYMPWYFWLGLAMEAGGLALVAVPRLVAAVADGSPPTDGYGLVPGLLVFFAGIGVAVLGYRAGQRHASE